MGLLLLSLLLLSSISLGLQDFRHRKIDLSGTLFFGGLLFLYPPFQTTAPAQLATALLAFGVLFLLKTALERYLKKSFFGLGDVVILSLLLPFLSLEALPLFLILSGSIGVLYARARPQEKNNIPLVTAFLIAFWSLKGVCPLLFS